MSTRTASFASDARSVGTAGLLVFRANGVDSARAAWAAEWPIRQPSV